MKGLKGVLKRKIIITAIFWCIPLLTFPASLFIQLGVPSPEPIMFVRLLGAAYLALLVGYYMGLKGLDSGENPVPVLSMGITSNGLAFLILTFFGVNGSWSSWGTGAQIFMWLSAAGALLITVNLLRFRMRVKVI